MYWESAVRQVGEKKQIRTEEKKRKRLGEGEGRREKEKETEREREKVAKEREMYLKGGSHGTRKGHKFFFPRPAIPEVMGHLKVLLRRGTLASFVLNNLFC